MALDLRFGALLSTCALYDCSIDTLIQYLSSSRLYRSVEASTRGRSALVCSRQPRQPSPVNCQALINTTLSIHKCNHKAKAKADLHCNPIIPPPLHPILTSRFRDTLSYSCASFRLSTRNRGYAMKRNAWGGYAALLAAPPPSAARSSTRDRTDLLPSNKPTLSADLT